MPRPRIALVDRDDAERNHLLNALFEQGLECWGAPCSELFYQRLFREKTDIVLFDLPNQEPSQFDALAPLVDQPNLGLMVMSHQPNADLEKQAMLAGADYFFAKPLDFQILLITTYTLWRRMQNQPVTTPDSETNSWQLDTVQQALLVDPLTLIPLSTQEFAFLSLLMAHPGTVLSKEEIHLSLFPDLEQFEPHRLSVLLNRLRLKLKQHNQRLPVRALYGRGYVFLPQTKDEPPPSP